MGSGFAEKFVVQMFSIWTSAKTGSLVFPADQVPEALRTGGAATVLLRAPWFGRE
jgi:hypothetical protein